ncbi:hypothetical protein B296_00024794 [Ensete ventricosum]|uniref:Uncharacterized protein n=1 Tax=Ensete ventricosum TaxID=4639 RepID=A0A427AAN9_ENSVE|nr:hypothetical protein B296_00024794 [Ensete ventricosum]
MYLLSATGRNRQNRSLTIDFGRQRLIEGEIDRRRSIDREKGKKKKKKKKRKRRKKKKRLSLRRPRLCIVASHAPSSPVGRSRAVADHASSSPARHLNDVASFFPLIY